MKLTGAVTISKVHSNQTPEPWIEIQVEDRASGMRFCEVSLSLEDFAEAITGLGFLPCSIEVQGLDKLGLVREHQTVGAQEADRSAPYGEPDRQAYWDAWVGQNFPGWHFGHAEHGGIVSLHRWVEPEDAEDEEEVE